MGKVSNPYNFNIKQNYIVNSELNFAYNFSIIVGSWSAVGFTYYGYTEDVAGSLVVNNTKYRDIDLFSTDNVKWEYYGFRFGYIISRNSFGYHYGSRITLPTGEIINYNTGDPKQNSSLYKIMNYLQSNNGKQIYLRVE